MSIQTLRRIAIASAVLALVACGDDANEEQPTGDGGGGGETTEDTGGGPTVDAGVEEDVAPEGPVCLAEERAFFADIEVGQAQGFGIQYFASEVQQTPFSVMYVDFKSEEGAPTTPGTFDLSGTNYADCEVCVWAMSDCDAAQRSCQTVYYADAGEFELTNIDETNFAGVIRNATFTEVTIDQATQVSTPVESGDAYCMSEWSFDVAVETGPAFINQQVRDFELLNCESGEMESLSDISGGANAMWLVATAEWCSACRQFIPQVIENTSTIPDTALQVAFIMGENLSGGEPTLSACQNYARSYEDDATRFYLDHDGQFGFATTFTNINLYTDNGQFGLPWNAILDGRDLTYLYSDGPGGDVNGDLNAVVNGLLAE